MAHGPVYSVEGPRFRSGYTSEDPRFAPDPIRYPGMC